MDRNGIVIEEMGSYSKLQLVRHTACGSCGACHLGDEQKEITLIAKNDVGAHKGDLVEVEMATESVLSAAFIMYVLPLIGLLTGLGVGHFIFGKNDVLTALSGLLIMSIVFIFIKMNDKKFLKSDKYVAHVVQILQKDCDKIIPLG